MKHLKNFNENDEFQTKPGFVERRMKQQKEYESKDSWKLKKKKSNAIKINCI